MAPPTLTTFSTAPKEPGEGDEAATAPHFLLAQVKTNMTITKPTIIATDSAGEDFAFTFDDAGTDLSGFRAGYTVVIPNATVSATSQGRMTGEGKGFIKIPAGKGASVRVVPAKLERVKPLVEGRGSSEDDGKERCAGCDAEAGGEEGKVLKKCLGCGVVRYCGKECQTKAWTEGHKGDCKALKVIAEIWP